MAGTFDVNSYADALVILGTAGVVVPIVRRLGLSSVLGYLAMGAALGPHALGSLRDQMPWLSWVTIADARSISGLAELGVVFLLFLIGLELSLARLITMRRLVLGLGMTQVVASTTAIALVLLALDVEKASAIVIGACLALSSTAIVIEILSDQGRLGTATGRTSFSILFAQDLAVMPILLIISVLAAGAGGSVLGGVGVAVLQAVLGVSAIVFLGRVALKPLFRLVANVQSTELFMASTVFVIVVTSLLAAMAGLSMALGAFVAGLLLAETEYRKVIQTHIEPFKGLLLGVFFFTVGMGIDVPAMLISPWRILAALIGLIIVKGVIIYGLALLFKVQRMAALETALMIAPSGEFTLVGIGAALAVGVVGTSEASFALAVTSLSMALIPLLAGLGRRIDAWASAKKPPDPALLARPEVRAGHAIVVGHGRVGQVVSAMLRTHNIPYIATDSDARAVSRERRAGHEVFYGDAANRDYLNILGLADARAVIITIHTARIIDEIVPMVRAIRPDIPIVARARDAAHARHLYAIGVTDAVPETIEASLQLSEAALVDLGVPMGLVIASIHEKRDEFRHE
ncbi:MAG: cation:proton antiporter, partial [Bosea sp. (in: a-proteobacteria)]